VNAADTIHELNDLRRGRGLNAVNIDSRVGPRIRAACAINDSDGPSQIRRKLVLRLTTLCEQLPTDLRLAASVALALHDDATGEFLDRRISWLAEHYDRDPRTARRRVDAAFRLLSERLDDDTAPQEDPEQDSPEGWYVQSLRAVLRVDLDEPQLTEERRIVATVDGLKEITVSVRAPMVATADLGGLAATMTHGGEIVESQHVSPGHTRFVIRLSEALHLGQRHEYGIRFTSYPRSCVHPYDMFAPLHRCEDFAVRVQFGDGTQPDLVWQLRPQGMSYGLQWSA
jgi:hypothetical protein